MNGRYETTWKAAMIAAEYNKLRVEELFARTKIRRIAIPRFGLIWVLRERCGYTLVQLARQFSMRDHTSVLHALRRAEELRADSRSFHAYTEYLLACLDQREAA
jgi:chromosomal replication initiator protein